MYFKKKHNTFTWTINQDVVLKTFNTIV